MQMMRYLISKLQVERMVRKNGVLRNAAQKATAAMTQEQVPIR